MRRKLGLSNTWVKEQRLVFLISVLYNMDTGAEIDAMLKVNITNKFTSFSEERIAHQKSLEELRSSSFDEYNTERTK